MHYPVKNIYTIFGSFLLFSLSLSAQVKIGENITNVSPYALFELESSTRGLLLPRMSDKTRDLAFDQEAPEGLLIFNTDKQCFQVFTYVFDSVTEKLSPHKTWKNLSEKQIFSRTKPENPKMGDLFYDPTNNTLSVWNQEAGEWKSIGGASTANLQEVILSEGSPMVEATELAVESIASGMLYANRLDGTLYMSADKNKDNQSDAWIKVGLINNTASPLAYNGISVSIRDEIELGGRLTKPTTLESSALNTLAITGLQSTVGSETQEVMVVEKTTGILRTQPLSGLMEESIESYVVNKNGERFFFTPKLITDQRKVNVYRNGVLINFDVVNEKTIVVESDAVCFQGDEIRIIQFN